MKEGRRVVGVAVKSTFVQCNVGFAWPILEGISCGQPLEVINLKCIDTAGTCPVNMEFQTVLVNPFQNIALYYVQVFKLRHKYLAVLHCTLSTVY